MGILSLDLSWDERARIQQQHREWNAVYKILMSNITDGPREMLEGMPFQGTDLRPYAVHPDDPAALVAEFMPQRLTGTNVWDLAIRWSTDVDISTSPLSAPAQVQTDTVLQEVPALFDVNGNVVCNVAGDLFTDPPLTTTVVGTVLRVTKNLPTSLAGWTQTYPDTVNNDTVTIRGQTYPPGTLYFSKLQIGSDQNVPGATDTISTLSGKSTPYATASFELTYRAQGWTVIVPNWGYFQLVPNQAPLDSSTTAQGATNALKSQLKMTRALIKKIGPYTRQRITVGNPGTFPPHPVFLDARGKAILNPTFDQIVTLEFDLRQKMPFAVLPFR